jgi:hypothetical protein
MSPRRLPFIILCLFGLQNILHAQDRAKARFGKVSPADFTLPNSPIIDSNANAVILTDAGATSFVGNEQGWFSYVFKKHIRIKIINKKAFDLATVKIPYYTEESAQKLDNLAASTYNLENGVVVETKLNKNEVFDDKTEKNYSEKRFTLPAMKEGSIIEYSYTLTSDRIMQIPAWEFQSGSYPCLWSDYEVTIPQLLFYVLVKQGIHEYFVDKGEEGHESYRIVQKEATNSLSPTDRELTVSANTVKHHWVMKDIPAFHVENYISSPRNYIDQIEFQLSKTYSGEDAREAHDVMNTWSKATEQLLAREDFGKPLSDDTYYLDKMLGEITASASSPLDQAKAIYYYVSSHFTCTNHYNPHLTTTLKDVLQKRNGTVGDLNLLLIALLRKDAIQADPVLLSTRENGFDIPTYPMVDRLNYLIVRVEIGDQSFYLDAAHRDLGFGQLADNCYNGHARIISVRDSGSVYFSADSLNDKRTTMVLITNTGKGGIEGSFQSTLNYPGSYDLREEINETGKKGYFKGIQTAYGEDVTIGNTGIDSLDKPEMPVKVYYDFKLNQPPGSDIFYFNPLFGEAYRNNPFTVLDRKYPVEMLHATDHTYILNMEIPRGYTVDELPKSARVALNGEEGLFEYLVSSDGEMIQMRTRLKLNKANFLPEDYSSLRDFFGFIVKKEGEQIVLKKK